MGPPKAVMLSHDNLTWDAFTIGERVGDLQPTYDRIISFLPLSHVAAQVTMKESRKEMGPQGLLERKGLVDAVCSQKH